MLPGRALSAGLSGFIVAFCGQVGLLWVVEPLLPRTSWITGKLDAIMDAAYAPFMALTTSAAQQGWTFGNFSLAVASLLIGITAYAAIAGLLITLMSASRTA